MAAAIILAVEAPIATLHEAMRRMHDHARGGSLRVGRNKWAEAVAEQLDTTEAESANAQSRDGDSVDCPLIVAKVRGGEVVGKWKPTAEQTRLSAHDLWTRSEAASDMTSITIKLPRAVIERAREYGGCLDSHIQASLYHWGIAEHADMYQCWTQYVRWLATEAGLISRVGRPAFDGSRPCNMHDRTYSAAVGGGLVPAAARPRDSTEKAMRIKLEYTDAKNSLDIDAPPDRELAQPSSDCIGMIFVVVENEARKQGASEKDIAEYINTLVAGGKAYLAKHRKGMGGAERLGGAN